MADRWDRFDDAIDCAFQPIVSLITGHCFGYETMIRGVEALGFDSATALFDRAQADGMLFRVEMAMRAKALAKFRGLAGFDGLKLFINIDSRLTEQADYDAGALLALTDQHEISRHCLVMELAEQSHLVPLVRTEKILRHYHAEGLQLALHDFGTGLSGYRLLYRLKPTFLKLDRFFIDGIDRDHTKKVLTHSIVSICHALGVRVLAEGLETEREFTTIRDLGVDLGQGFAIAPPMTDITGDAVRYLLPGIETPDDPRPAVAGDQELIDGSIDLIPPLGPDTPMPVVFERFRADKDHTFIPVIDRFQRPLGLVRERDLKDYVYSPFGKELLSNQGIKASLLDFVSDCPAADVSVRAEQLVEIYSGADAQDGVIITRDSRYAGVLSARALLRLVHEKNLAVARDQNPLTKLPGNNVIIDYVGRALDDTGVGYTLVYFDFDHFKPFNDSLGFARGDQAILLFADILRDTAQQKGAFIGHVGGDDFFLGFRDVADDVAEQRLAEMVENFRLSALRLYDPESQARGSIRSKDRDGNPRDFPLLSVSGVVAWLRPGRPIWELDALVGEIAKYKTAAKLAPSHLASVAIAARSAA